MVVYFLSLFVPFVSFGYDSRNCNFPFLRNHTLHNINWIDNWFCYSSWIIFEMKVVGPDVHDYMVWVLAYYAQLYIIFYNSNFCTWETSNINAMLVIYFWWQLPFFSIFYYIKVLHFMYLLWVQVLSKLVCRSDKQYKSALFWTFMGLRCEHNHYLLSGGIISWVSSDVGTIAHKSGQAAKTTHVVHNWSKSYRRFLQFFIVT